MMVTIADTLKKAATYRQKSPVLQQLILDTAQMLEQLGIPVDTTPRRLERMVLAFLAVANVKQLQDWRNVAELSKGHMLTSRQIINYLNDHFAENISSGSYDDIRRKDLKLPVAAGLIIQPEVSAARNNPTRTYQLNPELYALLAQFQTSEWDKSLEVVLRDYGSLKAELNTKRQIPQITVRISSDKTLNFGPGKHNQLQKAIIEDFLPRYGYGAELLYVGDASDKFLLLESEKLQALQFFEIKHGELPDVIAYSASKNWLYLIEAVHSSGPIDVLRHRNLQQLASQCTASLIFVTAFLDRKTFRKFVADIAWETEVWIAQNPDHLIHFNGGKFLGPYE